MEFILHIEGISTPAPRGENSFGRNQKAPMTSELPSHAVRSRKFFYGPSENVGIAFVGTLAECRDFITADNAEIYRIEHNESGRWSLKVVTTASLRPYALREAEYRQQVQAY